ncbi:MAG: hypothetical protein ACI85U_002260 [Candidatus Promineifilaceae bacterium]|jgi:hypothetical protein
MLKLPEPIMTALTPFRPVFHLNTWQKAKILLVGAILAPRIRTVTAVLRVMGLSQEKQFRNEDFIKPRSCPVQDDRRAHPLWVPWFHTCNLGGHKARTLRQC